MKKRRRDEGCFWEKRKKKSPWSIFFLDARYNILVSLPLPVKIAWIEGDGESAFFALSSTRFPSSSSSPSSLLEIHFYSYSVGPPSSPSLSFYSSSHYLLILTCLWFDNNSRERERERDVRDSCLCQLLFLSFGNNKFLFPSCHKKRWQTKEKMRERVKHLKKDKILKERGWGLRADDDKKSIMHASFLP